jgi:hypothetical protein
MKCFIILFALYIATLHTVPCADQADHFRMHSPNALPVHHQQQDKADGCTPFCICSCCNVAGIVLPLFVDGKPGISREITVVSFIQKEFVSFHTSFWQPPKIS